MNMSEKLAALSDPEYVNHYSSLPNEEILRLWDTTQVKDTERYFIYREILDRGLESHLLSSRKNRRNFLSDNEYLIAEQRDGWWGYGGFTSFKPTYLFYGFLLGPIFIIPTLGKMYPSSLLIYLWALLTILLLLLLFSDSLTQSSLFLTNRRIGYQFKILRVFKLPPKSLDLNGGHFISNVYHCGFGLGWGLFCPTKKNMLKSAMFWIRLDRYDLFHQRIDFCLNPVIAIYLYELIYLVTKKTNALCYTPPILLLNQIEAKDFWINYRFKGCQIEDLQNFFQTIKQQGALGDKNRIYLCESNMERLASFFSSNTITSQVNQLNDLWTCTPETNLAYFYGSKWGFWKSPLICFNVCGVQSFRGAGGKLKFEYNWSDPDLTIEVSLLSVNIMYKKKKVGYVSWNVIDVPLFDALAAIGVQKIYPKR